MWCSHVVLTLKSGWNWYDVTIQTKYLWQHFLCFSKLNFEFLSYLNFCLIWIWPHLKLKVFFFSFFLGSGKGEALITVIANHIPRDKKQDVDEEQQFWTSVVQKHVDEKTLVSVRVEGAKKSRVKFPMTWLLHFTLWINQYYTLVSMFVLPFVYRLLFEIMMALTYCFEILYQDWPLILQGDIYRWTHSQHKGIVGWCLDWGLTQRKTYKTC